MDFSYSPPRKTVRHHIQFLSIRVAEGLYAGIRTSACGDSLACIAQAIRKIARETTVYTKVDVTVDFPGWVYKTRYDVGKTASLGTLLDFIDAEARYYSGERPAHMEQAHYDALIPYMNAEKIDSFCQLMRSLDNRDYI